MITFDYGRGEGGKKCQNIDFVICERPLIEVEQSNHGIYQRNIKLKELDQVHCLSLYL